MARRLEGKIALITGTASGMGQATAVRFASEGARVYGCDISVEGNAKTAEIIAEQGGDFIGSTPVDLSDPEAAKAWIDMAGTTDGRIDVLFNNAASPRFAPVPELSVEDWDYTIKNELSLVFYACKFAWPYLARNGGVIINNASTAARIATPGAGMVAHCAAKGGVLALTKMLAADGVADGIRAVSLSPGGIRTPELERNFLNKVPDAENKLLSILLSKRIGEPADVAALATFLASDEAAYITGTDILIDGGMTAV